MTTTYETLATRNLPRIDALSQEDRSRVFATVAYTELFASALRVLGIPAETETFNGIEVNRILDQLSGTALMTRALDAIAARSPEGRPIESGSALTPWDAAA